MQSVKTVATHPVSHRRGGRVAPGGTPKGGGIWADDKETEKKLKKKTKKEKKKETII